MADESYLLGPGPAPESYLNVEKLLEVAKQSGAEAIHPGYGFLAENAAFAKACEKAKLVFIGPPAEAIEAMGSKTRARELMQAAGVPIVPGTTEPVATLEGGQADRQGDRLSGRGQGGRRRRRQGLPRRDVARTSSRRRSRAPSREGEKFFSDPTVYLERYLEDPRHVEVQVLADCAGQRGPPRRARLLGPAPPPEAGRGDAGAGRRRGVPRADRQDRDRRRRARSATARPARSRACWRGTGRRARVLLPRDEHPRPGRAHGHRDGDRHRHRAASRSGSPPASRSRSRRRTSRSAAASIECRINAEAAHKKFAPAPGRITTYREPAGPGVRVDSGVEAGAEITPLYDPMIAKLIVWDRDREAATARMLRALDEFEIGGVTTLIPFHKALLRSEQWRRGETCRDLVEDPKWLKSLAPGAAAAPPPRSRGASEKLERDYTVEVERPPLLGQGDRAAARRRRGGCRANSAGASARAAARAVRRASAGRRERDARLPAPGHGPQGRTSRRARRSRPAPSSA